MRKKKAKKVKNLEMVSYRNKIKNNLPNSIKTIKFNNCKKAQ